MTNDERLGIVTDIIASIVAWCLVAFMVAYVAVIHYVAIHFIVKYW